MDTPGNRGCGNRRLELDIQRRLSSDEAGLGTARLERRMALESAATAALGRVLGNDLKWKKVSPGPMTKGGVQKESKRLTLSIGDQRARLFVARWGWQREALLARTQLLGHGEARIADALVLLARTASTAFVATRNATLTRSTRIGAAVGF